MIRRGIAFACFGIRISSTPSRPAALTLSASTVSGCRLPAGYVDLTIPPHSANGRKLHLKNRGIPTKQPGDLYVVLTVALPKASTETAKSAYEAFGRALDFDPRAKLGM